MKLRQLRCFVAVAEELNFTRAAARVNLAQPSLSRHIKMLEEELGIELVRRDRQSVELTGAGQQFLSTARHALATLEAGVQAIKQPADALQTLRVAFPEYANFGETPKFLDSFQERFPEVKLERLELHTGPLLDALQEERADVGFNLAHQPHDVLAAEPAEVQEVMLVLPENHRLAERSHVSFKDLEDELLLFYKRALSPGFYDALHYWCERAGFEPTLNVPTKERVYSLSTMLRMVAADEGLHPLIASKVSHLQQAPSPNNPMTGLVVRPFLEPYTRLNFSAVWRKADNRPVVKNFLGLVRELRGHAVIIP